MKRLVLGLGLSVLAALPIILLSDVGQAATVAPYGVDLLNEGASQGIITKLDCVGGAVNCTRSGTTGTITSGSDYFDPREYGALCDGATDDYDAFMHSADGMMTAIRVAGGGAVQIPAGDCRSSGAILSGLGTPIVTTSTGTSGGSLTAGTYYYRVSATNAVGETIASTEKSIVVAGTGNDDTATATWTAINGATGYKVYGRTTGAEQLLSTWNGSSWSPASSGSTATSFIDYGTLTPSGSPTADTAGSVSQVWYGQGPGISSITFTANTAGLDFAFSSFTQYGAVKGLSVYTTVANSNRAIRVAWPDTSTNNSHYKMCAFENDEIMAHPSASSLVTPVNAAFSTATTGGVLANSTTYWYRVVATNAVGGTLASTQTSQTTGAAGGAHTVTVNWGAVTGATGYQVYCRTTGAQQLCATWNGTTWTCYGSATPCDGTATSWVDAGSVVTPTGALPTVDTAAASWLIGLSLNDAWECLVHDMQFKGRYNDANPGPTNWVTGSRGIEIAGASIDLIMHTIQWNSWEISLWCCGLGAGDGVPGVEGIQIQNTVMNRTLQGFHIFSDVAAAANMAVPWVSVSACHVNANSVGLTLKNRYEVIINGCLIYQSTSAVAPYAHFHGFSFNGCLRCKIVNSMVITTGDGGASLVERFMNIAAGTAGSSTAASADVIIANNTFLDGDCGSDATPIVQVDDASATNIQVNENISFGGCSSLVAGTLTNVVMDGNAPAVALASLPAVANGSRAVCANCGLSTNDSTCSTTSGVVMNVTRDGGAWKC